ncbi:MAG: Gfo/Idh/MocA family oxidoreductase [Clostridia bacterium]|nr:Gfo/Idh/MocA family oxidoreductase [Clostridia bacterium]
MNRLGLIGLGGIASRHIKELEQVKNARIGAICDVDETKLEKRGEQLGIDGAFRFADYRDLIACDQVDAVEICTPNYLHVPIALEALRALKPINVEKPLSADLASALELEEALKKNPVKIMMCFSYRFTPAVRFAKHVMDTGLLGEIINVDAAYLKASGLWENRGMEWRFEKDKAGSGVLGDLGVHMIDMSELLVGKMREVSAETKIVVKERKKPGSEEFAPVETDDYCAFLADTESGVSESFVITRCALGNANTIRFAVYGTRGVITIDLNEPDRIGVCAGEVDRVTETLHSVKVPKKFYLSQEQAFADLLDGNADALLPTVADGVRAQRVLDALLRSAETRIRVKI